ncbi:hypothetical protein PAEPH01_0268 [Pancytospora epiphaga]|nr:hypothetical protein PAEPH01_0268 [Pancytospora epiphaga]
MLTPSKLASLLLLAVPGLISSFSDHSIGFEEFGGAECLYTLNKYRSTKASVILEGLYINIHKMISDCLFPLNKMLYKYNQHPNPAVLTPASSAAEVYSALFNAQYFVPADLYDEYVRALNKRNSESILECYKLLRRIFCKKTRREQHLLKIIMQTASSLTSHGFGFGSKEKVTHIGFFVTKTTSSADYFLISRCGRVSAVKHADERCHNVFFLPYECLFLHKWLSYSLEFDLEILVQIGKIFNCMELVDIWKILYSNCSNDTVEYRRSGHNGYPKAHVHLKLFSFFIIASIMPDCPFGNTVGTVRSVIKTTFYNNDCDFTKFISASLAISHK